MFDQRRSQTKAVPGKVRHVVGVLSMAVSQHNESNGRLIGQLRPNWASVFATRANSTVEKLVSDTVSVEDASGIFVGARDLFVHTSYMCWKTKNEVAIGAKAHG